jgi:hypothetical protein
LSRAGRSYHRDRGARCLIMDGVRKGLGHLGPWSFFPKYDRMFLKGIHQVRMYQPWVLVYVPREEKCLWRTVFIDNHGFGRIV